MNAFLESQTTTLQEHANTQNEAFNTQLDSQKAQLDSLLSHIHIMKKSIFAFLFIVVCIAFLCGAFSFLAFYKFKEYKDIESKFHAINERLESVKILKNAHNEVVLSIPKSAAIKNEGKEYIINLGGGK